MDKESDKSPRPVVPPSRRTVRMESWERMSTGSPPVSLPNPYASNPRNNNFTSPRRKPAPPDAERDRRGGGGPNGPSNKHNDRRSTEAGSRLYTDKSRWDPQTKKSKHISDSQSQDRTFGERSRDGAKKALRGPRSAPSGARSPTGPPQAGRVSFQVKMADFPELAVAASGTSVAPGQTRAPSWGPKPQSQGPQTQGPLSSNKAPTIAERSRESPRTRLHNRDVKSVSSSRSPDGETLFTVDSGKAKVSSAGLERPASAASSWANVASQPPRKPAPDLSAQEDAAAAELEDKKKQRKRKKKKARGSEDEPEDPQVLQEPPKFEDEDEFPDLGRASVGPSRLTSSSTTAQLCNEECPKDVFRPQLSEQRKDNTPAGKTVPIEPTKKGQKGEKATGKKSKVPLQLDIGTMLEVLEKKHQSQKSKHDAKPLILSVGGALPVGLKQPGVQKKGAWQQDKIAHNPLDSTSPMVKKGKQREVPKAKKPTQLKRVILKEREERKQTRLLQERGLDPQQESRPEEPPAGQHDETGATDNIISPSLPEEDQPAVGERQLVDMEADGGREEQEEEEQEEEEQQEEEKQQEEEQEEQPEEQHTVEPLSQPIPNNRPKIHSRKFRDYCSQVLSKDVDECVSALLRELVRFQDRLYQKDPMKARMKKRLVMGLREVLKHLRLGKVKCVVISPNCERSQSKGGLDEALHTIIDTCREQGVPFVFALSRKALGRCVNKAVPVSLVGIFNYDGAQDFYHKMIELSSEARKAYEEMLERVEMMEQTEEVEVEVEEENQGQQRVRPGAPTPPPPQEEGEEPEYIKVWKKMLEKDCNHQFLSFEEHLTSLRLDSEDQTEPSDGDQQS